MSKGTSKPKKFNTLSFGDEEFSNEVVSSKPLKKLKQNTYFNYEAAEPVQPSSAAYSSSSCGAYSSSELQNLRQNQQFTSKKSSNSEIDGENDETIIQLNTEMNKYITSEQSTVGITTTNKTIQIIELTGEDAEQYDDLPDFIPLNSSKEVDGLFSVSSASSSSSTSKKRKAVSFGADETDDRERAALEPDNINSDSMGAFVSNKDQKLIEEHRKSIKQSKSKTSNRLPMHNKADSTAKQRLDVESFTDEDDESRDWEEALARRAGIKQSFAATPLSDSNQQRPHLSIGNASQQFRDNNENDKTNANTLSAIAYVRQAIKRTLDGLRHTVTNERSQRKHMQSSIEQHSTDVAKLSSKLEKGMESLLALQDLKVFLADLVGMLREKTKAFEQIETEYFHALEEIQMLRQRDRKVLQDSQLLRLHEEGLLVSLNGYLPISSHQFQFSNDSSKVKTQPLSISEIISLVGSVASLWSSSQSAERAPSDSSRGNDIEADWFSARDSVWKATLPRDVKHAIESACAGSKSFSSLATTDSKQLLIHTQLIDSTEQLLADCQTELKSVGEVLTRVKQFRKHLPGRYTTSFVSLSLGAIVSPLVQFDIVRVPFFSVDVACCSAVLEERDWYSPLLDFTVTSAEDINSVDMDKSLDAIANGYDVVGNTEGGNSDDNLLPAVMSNVVFMWLQRLIAAIFDPYETKQCSAVASWITALIDFDISDSKLALVLSSITKKFEREIEEAHLPILDSHKTAASPLPEKSDLLVNQLLKRVKLAQNFFLFRKLISPKTTLQIVSTALFAPVVLTAMHQLLSIDMSKNAKVVQFALRIGSYLLFLDNEICAETSVLLPQSNNDARVASLQRALSDAFDLHIDCDNGVCRRCKGTVNSENPIVVAMGGHAAPFCCYSTSTTEHVAVAAAELKNIVQSYL